MDDPRFEQASEFLAFDPVTLHRRHWRRHAFRRASFTIRAKNGSWDIRLKDLSCHGASGLMCEPIGVGQHVIVEFGPRHQVEAEVCWVRQFLVGLTFTNPLRDSFVAQLRDKFESH